MNQPSSIKIEVAEKYRVDDLVTIPMGRGHVLASCRFTGATQVMTEGHARMLQGCRGFATIGEHAARLCNDFQIEIFHARSMSQKLTELAAAGFLVSRHSLIERCSSRPASAPPAISSLGVPTRNRPQSLLKCLSSYAKNCRDYHRSMRFLVADGSEPAIGKENLAALSSMKEQYDCELLYIGAEETQQYVDRLATLSGIDRRTVSFALLNDDGYPVDTGVHRNVLLLGSIDELTIQVDDDTECRLAPCPEIMPGIVLTSKFNPTDYWFIDKGERPPVETSDTNQDFFALHEQLLGKSIGSCLNDFASDEGPHIDSAQTSFFRRLNGDNRIWVSQLGQAGELGLASKTTIMTLDDNAHERLVKSQSAYDHVIDAGQAYRAASRTAITEGSFCSGLNLGLDNRQMLPPFMPVQRSQDSIFGRLVRASGHGFFGHVPHMVAHNRTEARTHSDLKSPYILSGEVIELFVGRFKPNEALSEHRELSRLADYLIEMGTLPPLDFEETLRQLRWAHDSQVIARCEELLQKYQSSPEFWALDIMNYLAALREAMPTMEYIVPSDLRIIFGAEKAIDVMQKLLRRFGELLSAWADLRKAASELRYAGYQLGTKI